MYDELVKRLHRYSENVVAYKLDADFASAVQEAADAIEKLMRFAYFVAREVVVSDEEWERNNLAFPEIASRKLNKLGIVKKDGAFWSYEPPKEE